jgi:hypothetical protein
MKVVTEAQKILLGIAFLTMGCKKDTESTRTTPSVPGADSISFSDYIWHVKQDENAIAPGPNFWDARNVWVDEKGRLHLRARKDPDTGTWTCSEVYSEEKFGFGTYQFWIDGRLDALDKNAVFGLFNYSGNDGYDEMDIEFSRWGDDAAQNASYTVWPATGSRESQWTVAYDLIQSNQRSTLRFKRSADAVIFQTVQDFVNDNSNTLFTEKYSHAEAVSKAPMPVHMNLWLVQGLAPSDQKEIEIIVNRFTFLPQ